MRVVFMGTPDFAVPSLVSIASHHEVVGVYTRPDSASGRGKQLRPSAVKAAALERGLTVLTPRTLRDPEALAELAGLSADVICVAAYGLILPKVALDSATLGAVNVHASLLPRWRGAAPIQRAILAGDPEAGVSIMRMEEGLDTGPYCLVRSTAVAEKTAAELTAELAVLGAEALLEALPSIEAGTAVWTEQDESLVTYAEKVTKDDVAPRPELTAVDNARRVRAASAQAPARVLLGGRGVALLRARVTAAGPFAGETSAGDARETIVLGCASGALEVSRLKPDGKAEMDAAAWLCGVRDVASLGWAAAR